MLEKLIWIARSCDSVMRSTNWHGNAASVMTFRLVTAPRTSHNASIVFKRKDMRGACANPRTAPFVRFQREFEYFASLFRLIEGFFATSLYDPKRMFCSFLGSRRRDHDEAPKANRISRGRRQERNHNLPENEMSCEGPEAWRTQRKKNSIVRHEYCMMRWQKTIGERNGNSISIKMPQKKML